MVQLRASGDADIISGDTQQPNRAQRAGGGGRGTRTRVGVTRTLRVRGGTAGAGVSRQREAVDREDAAADEHVAGDAGAGTGDGDGKGRGMTSGRGLAGEIDGGRTMSLCSHRAATVLVTVT